MDPDTSETKILITGACGQVGTELTIELRKRYGNDAVLATDIRQSDQAHFQDNAFEILDVTDKARLIALVEDYKITEIYHLASILSAKGEQNPTLAWNINMTGLLNVLEVCVSHNIQKVFWPSSIAVFGPNSPKIKTPQFTIMDPDTVYGISKLAGERWCHHYHYKHDIDVRSLRYPGLISYKSPAGGGTTDYAVDIYFEAINNNQFECFLEEDTILPMMYMDDAIRATIELMEAPKHILTVHSSYNIAGVSFSPDEITKEIKKHLPSFKTIYKPDFRQQIADTWPESIDDEYARVEWGWIPEYNLEKMTENMLANIKEGLTINQN